MTRKMNISLGGALVFLTAFLGNGRAEDATAWELTGKGFRSRDLEVKILENGKVKIYDGAEQLLAVSKNAVDWNELVLSNAVWSVDATNRTIVLTMQAKGCTDNYVQKMRAVENGIEITTEFPRAFMMAFYMNSDWGCRGYDGGRWQSDSGKGGTMVARTNELPTDQRLGGAAGEDTVRLSFWRKDSERGFSVENIKKNKMTLWDCGKADKNGNPLVYYAIWMNARTGDTWRNMMLIKPARRSSQDIKAHCIESKTQISVPLLSERYGYVPTSYPLPVEVAILPSKMIAGDYKVQCLILDQTDNEVEVVKKEEDISVTEAKEGKVNFDLIAPDRCALYWLRIRVKDKGGNVIVSKEYPFAVIVKLPPVKDIPASSPLGGQPLVGGYMPEGRFVGMKWDRFWAGKTSWNEIELEKGK